MNAALHKNKKNRKPIQQQEKQTQTNDGEKYKYRLLTEMLLEK